MIEQIASPPPQFHDIVEPDRLRARLARAPSKKQLIDTTFKIARTFGATSMCYAHNPPLGAIDFTRPAIIESRGLPKGWTKTYISEEYYDHDPIARVALSHAFPFKWKDVKTLTKVSPREQDYLDHLHREGIECGLCVPTFGPRGRNGYFGVGFDPADPWLHKDDVFRLQWICQTAHLFYCELETNSQNACADLSKREVDVLRLVLYGLSNVEIAAKLQISDRSVATYLDRAHGKLNSRGRFEAATRALVVGLLD